MSNTDFDKALGEVASRIQQSCKVANHRFVLAESCTAGLISAALSRQPGISDCFCGSAVTYRNQTKQQWLNVQDQDLVDSGPVSALVAAQMAEGVLTETSEAQVAAAVTGHLGPAAPTELDGVIYVAVAVRSEGEHRLVVSHRLVLAESERRFRQQEAALSVLQALDRLLLMVTGVEAVIQGKQDMFQIGSDCIEFVFPGSFEPLHAGHRAMACYVEEHHQQPVFFEISVTNVDKPTLSRDACLERILPFCFDGGCIISRAPTFLDKARLYGPVQFVTGVDTIARVGQKQYYGDEEQRDQALQEINQLGCQFIVFGREMDSDCQTGIGDAKQFVTLDQLGLPSKLSQMCHAIAESEFRHDQSSRDLR